MKGTPKPAPLHAQTTDALVTRAAFEVSREHHKEATELYKELVRRERRPAWVDALAACYAARAQNLAAKAMHKEALVLWRNRAQICAKPLIEGAYLGWLSAAGEQGELLRLLNQEQLPEAVLAELEARLAPVVLAASDKALPKLPADSALLRHRPIVLAALAAYQRADDAALAEQLQAIPYRSPYRDLKPVLKALALFHSDLDAAQAAVARLPDNGPFEPMVTLLRAAAEPGAQWLARLPGLDDNRRQVLFDLKGCPAAARPLLTELGQIVARGKDGVTASTLYDLLHKHRKGLPAGAAAALCLRLMPRAGNRLRQYQDAFGVLDEIRIEHLVALAAEACAEPEHAEDHWMRMAELLARRGGQEQRAALIWRHLAEGAPQDNRDGRLVHYLGRSVALDPKQADLHVQLVKAWRMADDKRAAEGHLKQALALFPADPGLLLEAVESALAAKAYKKAVGLARQVLALDPINPTVRALIGHALLSHARKQIKAGKPEAARKELDAAAEWLRTPAEHAGRSVLLALVSDDAGAADALLRAAYAQFGGALAGAFHLLLEAGRCGSDPRALLTRVVSLPLAAPTVEAVLALARALDGVHADQPLVRAALQQLHAPLKLAAAGGALARDDMLSLCESYQSHGDKTLLGIFATAGLKRWPQDPAFVYFKSWERHGAAPRDMGDAACRTLLDAQDRAGASGDQRTVARISALLEAAFGGADDDDDYDDEFGGAPSFEERDLVRAMVQAVGEKAFLRMGSEMLGKRAFELLRKSVGGDKQAMIEALIDLMAETGPPGMPAMPPFQPAQLISPEPPRRVQSSGAPNAPTAQKGLFDD